MAKFLAALDQGTTSSRCILFDKNGVPQVKAQRELDAFFPQPGWVEHDPMAIWSTQLGVLTEAKARAGIMDKDIVALGITNQRETTIVWEKATGRPVYNAIGWQCRRTSAYCDELREEGFDKRIREKTGLILDAYFSATKIRWILKNVEGAAEKAERGELLFGTVDTWLVWQLTKGRCHITDYSNASRTMLFNIHTLEWDQEILEKLEIPRSLLPEVRPSSEIYDYTDKEYLRGNVPIAGIAGDQQAALFGQCCYTPGMTKNTYGTGAFLLMNTGGKPVISKNGLLTTIAWGIDGQITYALEGSVFVAGAVIQWLRDGLNLLDWADDSEKMAESVKDTAGVYFVPAFTGLGAPYWDQYARGTMVGLTRGTKKEHIVRAALEAIAYQSADVIRAMEADAGASLSELRVDGGASSNRFLLQFQSNILDTEVVRPKVTETTALGAAYLAGLAVGFYTGTDEILKNTFSEERFRPSMNEETRETLLSGWDKAISRSARWAENK